MKNKSSALNTYENAFRTGAKPAQPIAGIQGRFCRRKPTDPVRLSDDPNRRIVFLVDHLTCHSMVGLTGYQVTSAVGWNAAYTKKKVEAGLKFEFVAFAEGECKLGTWQNMLDLVDEMYPEIALKLRRQHHALRTMTHLSLRDIETRQGYKFLDVDEAGPTDPRFMTIERYRAAPDTADAARAFLYHVVHLKELYRGDGLTMNDAGQTGVREYVMPDKPLDSLGEHVILPVDVQIPRVASVSRAPVGGELPVPPFFQADNAAAWTYVPKLCSFMPGEAPGLLQHAESWKKMHNLKPVATDKTRVALVLIDMQLDFVHPDGTLYVAGRSGDGAIVDCANVASFIYRNIGKISSIIPTMDTHFAYQIFFPSFWVRPDGSHPSAHTEITVDMIERGDVKPNMALAKWACGGDYLWMQKQVHFYCEELKKAGKYTLYLWPPHCILGTQGHALAGVVAEAMQFWAYARGGQPEPQIKGGSIFAEAYSVFGDEVRERHDGKGALSQKNTNVFKLLMGHDAVIFGGEAASHCVKSSVDDFLSEILAKDPSLAEKVYVLQDCTSSVVVPGVRDYTPEAEAAMARYAKAGMHLVKSETPMAQWPGMHL